MVVNVQILAHETCDCCTIVVCYCRAPKFSPYGSVCCACAHKPDLPRACHSGYFFRLTLQTSLSAMVAVAQCMRLHQAFSHTQRLVTINMMFSPMGQSLWFPTVAVMMHEVCTVLRLEAPTIYCMPFVRMCVYVAANSNREVVQHELCVSATMCAVADTSMRQCIFLLMSIS